MGELTKATEAEELRQGRLMLAVAHDVLWPNDEESFYKMELEWGELIKRLILAMAAVETKKDELSKANIASDLLVSLPNVAHVVASAFDMWIHGDVAVEEFHPESLGSQKYLAFAMALSVVESMKQLEDKCEELMPYCGDAAQRLAAHPSLLSELLDAVDPPE